MGDKVRFRAEPGTKLVAAVGADARSVEWDFDEHGILEFAADDQEPIAAIRHAFVREGGPVTEEPADASSLTAPELRSLLERRGLSTEGKKAELVERLEGSGTEVAADGEVIGADVTEGGGEG